MKRYVCCLAGVLCLGFSIAAGAADRPGSEGGGPLVLRTTWWESLLASREALVQREAEAEQRAEAARQADPVLKVFQTQQVEMTPRDEPRKIRVRIAGLKKVFLGARGPQEAAFADPQLIGRDGHVEPLPLAKVRQIGPNGFRRYEPKQGGEPLAIGKRKFTTGWTMQNAEVGIELDEQAEWLELWVGVRPRKEDSPATIWIQWRSLMEQEATAAAARETVASLVAEAFPSPADICQQRAEATAGIWKADWKPGDLAELARRYADACADQQKQVAQDLAKRCRTVAHLTAVRDRFYMGCAGQRLAQARQTLELVERAAARPQLAAELAALQKRFAEVEKHGDGGAALFSQARQLRRRIILSHPALDFAQLLINKRTGFLPEHMCDQYLGRHSQRAPGLVVLDDWKEAPKETVLLEGQLPPGATIHPDLSYDGTRVLFAFADHSDPRAGQQRGYYIYEYSFDTGSVRQVTGTASDPKLGQKERQTVLIEDIDPCYLPDGGFAFISTRSQQYGRCHGGRYVPSYTLYRGQLDGTGIRPLSYNESNEWGPAMLNDGSLIYTRWDYVDRNNTIYQSLWVMHPDGTQTAHYYKNNSRSPCLVGETQPIPDSPQTVATAAAHHGQTLGTLIAIDPRRGQDHGLPLTWITPELPFPESGIPEGITLTDLPLPDDLPLVGRQREARAGTPWPLGEELFLCTYQHGSQYAIYLIDVLGGRELIYRDPKVSCFDPIPLRPRPTPPVLHSPIADTAQRGTGVFFIQDVYQCSSPLERGSIKRLRINEIISQPTSSVPARSLFGEEVVKRILGTVPVGADGSAAFEAPANTPFQLQLLDEHGMAVMTMRSLVYLQPGEQAACAGCHEPRSSTPAPAALPAAKVERITPPVGPRYPGGFSFARTVQPVLDRYCIGCHGLDKTERDISLLGVYGEYDPQQSDGRRGPRPFSVAYESLTRHGGVRIAGNETTRSRAKDYFAHASRLAPMLLQGHPDKDAKKRVELDRDSFQRIVDWLDVNAQCYGDYSFNRIEQQPPAEAGEKLLREAVAKRFGPELARQPYAALVNAAHLAESRILMAPLPVAAGGWGQIARGAYQGQNDSAWQEMRKLVEGSITRPPHSDIAGTCGHDQGCRCGVCWVRQDRAARE